MNRIQFIITTSLSGVIALCIFLQIIFVRIAASDEIQLKKAEDQLQQGQLCYNRLQQIAGRIAHLAEAQNDQALKDLLTRQGIQIKPPADTGAAPAGTTPAPASSTH